MAITYPLTLAQAQAFIGTPDAKQASISVAVLSKCDATLGTWVDPGDHLPELRGGSESPALLAQLAANKTASDAAASAAATKVSQLAALKISAAQGKLTLADVNTFISLL